MKGRRQFRFHFEKENRYLGGDPITDGMLFSLAAYLSVGLSALFGIYHPSDLWENILGFAIIPYLSGLGVSAFLFFTLKILVPSLGHYLQPE